MNLKSSLSVSLKGYTFTVQPPVELRGMANTVRSGAEAIEAFSLVASAVVIQFRGACDNHARNGAGTGRLLNRRRR